MKHVLSVIALSVVCASGCGPRLDPAAAPAAQRRVDYQLPRNQVVFLEPALQKVVTVEANVASRTPGNTLLVMVTLRNRTDSPLRMVVRARFQGTDGEPLEESRWSELFLERRGLKDFAVTSTSTTATRYIIEVQPAR